MSATTTKQCKFCYSELDGRAKKCPHCQMLQGVWLTVAIFLPIAFVTLLVGLLIWSSQYEQFRADHSADLSVVDSNLYFTSATDEPSESKSATHCCVVGVLRNKGENDISYIGLEVQIYDKDGKLVDVFSDSVYGSSYPAGKEVPFRIVDVKAIHLPESEYASHTVVPKYAHSR